MLQRDNDGSCQNSRRVKKNGLKGNIVNRAFFKLKVIWNFVYSHFKRAVYLPVAAEQNNLLKQSSGSRAAIVSIVA